MAAISHGLWVRFFPYNRGAFMVQIPADSTIRDFKQIVLKAANLEGTPVGKLTLRFPDLHKYYNGTEVFPDDMKVEQLATHFHAISFVKAKIEQ